MTHNPYPGVNAHLNSALLQPYGGWESFHTDWIVQLRLLLTQHLPPHYYAFSERSLQLRSVEPDDERGLGVVYPDVSVVRYADYPPGVSRASQVAATATMPRRDPLLDDPSMAPKSVGICWVPTNRGRGQLVTRIELLSPGNKLGRGGHSHYLTRREQTLDNGVNLVELDTLYTTTPLDRRLPSYPQRDAHATPYYVLISVPQPAPDGGYTDYFAVPIDAPLPVLALPLRGEDAVTVDLQQSYNNTYDGNAPGWALSVDYTQPPADFHRYTPDDQARILALMQGFRHDA